jgi:hypothetical protein
VTPQALDYALTTILWSIGAFVYGWMTVILLARGVDRGDWRR